MKKAFLCLIGSPLIWTAPIPLSSFNVNDVNPPIRGRDGDGECCCVTPRAVGDPAPELWGFPWGSSKDAQEPTQNPTCSGAAYRCPNPAVFALRARGDHQGHPQISLLSLSLLFSPTEVNVFD